MDTNPALNTKMDRLTKSKYWHLSYWSDTWQQLPGKQRRQFRIIMLIHFLLTLLFISRQGINSDEGDYFSYALQWAKGKPERLYRLMDSKTPMVAFALVTAFFKQWLSPDLLANDPAFYLKTGRPFMYIYQLLGCYMVFCWLTRLWGNSKWLIPFLFFCFDPLIFSYSMFVGSDLPSAAILITIVYSAWRYTVSGNNKYWWLVCFAAAWGLLLKPSFIFCMPLLALLFFINALQKKQWNWKTAGKQFVQFVAVHLLFINIIYYFKGTGNQLGVIHFQSALLTHLQTALHFIKWIPVPLPAAFMQGFDLVQYNIEYGCCKPESTYRGVILFGKVLTESPVWYYYIVTALFKIPLLVWLAFVLFIYKYLINKKNIEYLKKYYFIWLPFLYFLIVLSFLFKVQIGIRHAILILPFFYIGISGVFINFFEKRKWLFTSLIILHCISVIRYWPNIMAYTNELIRNKTKAYQVICDSSIDYGQTNQQVFDFLKTHPDYKLPSNVPQAGKFAVTVGWFVNRYPDLPVFDYSWLRNNFEPDNSINYTILLFDISEADLQAKGLTQQHFR